MVNDLAAEFLDDGLLPEAVEGHSVFDGRGVTVGAGVLDERLERLQDLLDGDQVREPEPEGDRSIVLPAGRPAPLILRDGCGLLPGA